MTDGAESFSPLPVPAEYETLAKNDLDASVQDVAYLYAAHARDRQKGTSEASNFKDAVRMHHVIDQVSASSDEFSGATTRQHPPTAPWHQLPATDLRT